MAKSDRSAPAEQEEDPSRDERYFVKTRAAYHMLEVLDWMLPGGIIKGPNYVVRNPTRPDQNPGSFKIRVVGKKQGFWWERAKPTAHGTDLIKLLSYIRDISEADAIRQLQSYLKAKVNRQG